MEEWETHAGYVGPVMNVGPKPHTDISGEEHPEPVTRAIEVTLPTPAISLYNHSYTYLIHPSIAYAIVASQCFVSRHKVVVVSFDMSGNRSRFKGRPMKGSRPPHVKQSEGRKLEKSPSGLARPRSETNRDISTFLVRF